MTNARQQVEQRTTWRSITAFLAACTLMLTMLGLTQPSFSVDGDNADVIGAGKCTPGSGAVMDNLTDGDISIEVIDQREGAENEETIKKGAIVDNVSQRWSGEPYGQRFGISNTTANDDRTFRLYFQFAHTKDGEKELPYLIAGDSRTRLNVGETYYQLRDAKKNKYTFHKVEGSETYFIEVPAAEVGETFALDVYAQYPAESAGGTLNSWVEELTSDELAERGEKAGTPNCGTHNATWEVDRTEYQAVKQVVDASSDRDSRRIVGEIWGEPGDPKLAYDRETERYYIHNLRYLVRNERVEEKLAQKNVNQKDVWDKQYGEDPAVTMTYIDTFTVPEGFTLAPEIADAFKEKPKGNHRSSGTGFAWDRDSKYPGQSDGTATFNTLLAGYKPVLTVLNDDEYRTQNDQYSYEVSDDLRTITVRWTATIKEPATTRSLGPELRIKFADKALLWEGPGAPDASFHADALNHFEATTSYRHSGDNTTTADASAPIVASGVEPKVSKTHEDKTYYRGDAIDFTISAANEGTAAWKINEGRADEGKIVDSLPKAFYVTPAQMVEMFGAVGGNDLTVRIKDAQVCDATIAGRVSSSGENITPTAQTAQDCVTSEKTQIVITRDENRKLLVARNNESPVTVEASGEALAQALGQIVVAPETLYTLEWQIQDGVIHGGETVKRTVKATVKDQFMAGDLTAADATNTINLGKDVPDTAKIENSFALNKQAFVGGTEVTEDGSEISVGTVVDYTLSLERKGGQATYDSVPLIDDLSGAQVLLAEVELNEEVLGNRGLETREIEGTQVYVLDKPGEYRGVRFRAEQKVKTSVQPKVFVADRIVIEDLGEAGLKTSTYWYLASQDFANPSTVKVMYQALTDPKRAGFGGAGVSKDDIINVGTLDDRFPEGSDSKTFNISKLGSDKHIVLDKRNVSDLEDDAMTRQSKIADGEKVTYRLSLSKSGDQPFEVTGKDLYDALPKALGTRAWTKDTVAIEFPSQSSLTVKKGDLKAWNLTSENPVDGQSEDGQQYIVWGEGLELELTGSAYFYVTLNFPAGDDWQAYQNAFGAETLYNTWYVKDAKSQVAHYLDGEQNGLLQKGVSATGSFDTAAPWTHICYSTPEGGSSCYGSSNPDDKVLDVDETADGRVTYHDNGGYVMYYTVLHNDGASRLYVNDIEDVLPEGFVFGGSDAANARMIKPQDYNLVFPTEQDRLDSWDWVADAADVPVSLNGAASTPKVATIHASVDSQDPRKVTFRVDNSGAGSSLSYDRTKKRYYLNAGETLAFRYFAIADDASKLKNVATNWVGMPHDGGMANPVTVNPDIAISANEFKDNPLNDGTRDVVDGAGAAKLGMDGKDGEQWLVSNVSVERQLFVPGVTKHVTAKTGLGKTVADPEYAGYSDVLTWTVEGRNDSVVPISDYVMSDVLDEHYEFTGPVKFYTEDANGEKSSDRCVKTGLVKNVEDCDTLFTFGKWSTDSEDKKSVEITYQAPYFSEVTTTLTVDGPAQVLKYSPRFEHNQFYVSLSSVPESDAVRLDVRAPIDSEGVRPSGGGNAFAGMPIEPGGKAVLVVDGKRKADAKQDYRVAFNTGYLTPLSTGWNPAEVVHGSPTTQTVKAAENYLDYNGFGTPQSAPKTYTDQPSVQSVAQIPIADDLYTSSIERVVEVADATNDATSVSSPNYITLPSKDSVFRYEMNVTNKKSDSINKMVLINNLPQVGDDYTFATAPERLSEFKTAFGDELNLKVELVDADGKVLSTVDPSKYVIDFSPETDFNDADWAGSTASGAWLSKPADMSSMRSMRITLADDAGVIPGNGTLRVSFDSKIPDDAKEKPGEDAEAGPGEDAKAKPGEIAWNTFGYRYLAPGSKELMLSSIPLKVGVRIPSLPTLAKALVDGKGEPREAAVDSTYQFLVYSGEALTSAQLEGKSLEQALADEKRQVAFVERAVAKGKTKSEALPISPEKTYKYDAKAKRWNRTDTQWKWKDKAQYTLVEIGASDDSELARIEKAVPESKPLVTGNHTTFTYRNAENPEFTAVNRDSGWTATIHKLDGGNCTTDTECAPLEGAVFGVFTPNKAESEKALKSLSLPEEFRNKGYEINGTAYYPWKTVTSGENGIAKLDGLVEDKYVIEELSAPKGYSKGEKSSWTIRKPTPGQDARPLEVKNFPNYELPESGGDGFRPGYALAGLLIAGAIGGLYWRRRSVR